MNKERTVITQQLCDHVKALLAGKLTHKKAAEFTGIGKATVDRIVAAGFNAEQYAKNTASKRVEKKAEDARTIIGKYITAENAKKTNIPTAEQLAAALAPGAGIERALAAANQIEGQMEMDLRPAEEHEEVVYPELKAKRDERIMRFQAKQVDKIRADIQSTQYENLKAIYDLRVEMHSIRDLLGQILRRMK